MQLLPDRAVISISGDGALAWLDNLITCDVGELAVGQAAYGALLTPQGKILFDMFVCHDTDRILIDCALDHRPALLQKLMLYRLRAKLVIVAVDTLAIGVSAANPSRPLSFEDPRLAKMGWRYFVKVGELQPGEDYHKFRIQNGLPDSIRDLGIEKHFPHEANFDQFGAVAFNKGCYVGQEVVSRMQHRGTARSRMLPVRYDGVAATHLTSGGKPVGEVLSSVDGLGLALIRIDRLAELSGDLMAGTSKVHVERPDWITYDITIPEMAR